MSALQVLVDYVNQHAVRGSCECGQCINSPAEAKQPPGHTADVIFFKVANNGATAEELQQLVSNAKQGEFTNIDLFDGDEHNYMEIGGWIGDQGTGLVLMGLGAVLGLWQLVTPRALAFPEELVTQFAQRGMIIIQAFNKPATVKATSEVAQRD